MKASYIIRSLLILIALVGTIFSISLLRSNDGVSLFESLGFGKHTENTLAWCQTRVSEIKDLAGGVVVREENRKWLVRNDDGSSSREVPYLEMERWLGEFCQVKVDSNITADQALNMPVHAVLEILLLDQSKHTFYALGDSSHQFDGRSFNSSEWTQALQKLKQLIETAR